MKTIVAGGRNYVPTTDDWLFLNMISIKEIVSGGARGADAFGEAYANNRNLILTVFPAEWDKYGKGAGPIRNRQMAKYADAVILFPGGRGTENMKREAEKEGLRIYDPYNE